MITVEAPREFSAIYAHVWSTLGHLSRLIPGMAPPHSWTPAQIRYRGESLVTNYPFLVYGRGVEGVLHLTVELVEKLGLVRELEFLRVYSAVASCIRVCQWELILLSGSEPTSVPPYALHVRAKDKIIKYIWQGSYPANIVIPPSTEQLAILHKHLEGSKPVRQQLVKLNLMMP